MILLQIRTAESLDIYIYQFISELTLNFQDTFQETYQKRETEQNGSSQYVNYRK